MSLSQTFSNFRRLRRLSGHGALFLLLALPALLSAIGSAATAWALQTDAALTEGYTVTLLADGRTATYTTGGETVRELLDRLEVELSTYDSIAPDGDTLIEEDLTITLQRASVTYETLLEEVPYDTIYQEDPTLPEGTEQLLQAGEPGIHCSYYRNITTPQGVTYRRQIRSGVKTYPTEEIILLGTGQKTPEAPAATPQPAPSEPAPEVSANTITTAGGEVLTYSRVLTCTATAYTASPGALTATGTTPRVGAIAVDPRVIPYGTRMYILTSDGSIIYGHAVAEDCGGAIKGNRVDLYYNSYEECIQFGRRDVTVYILE